MPNGRVDIVARSNVPLLDVNRVLGEFGGGGHPGAASAKVRGEEIRSVRRRLAAVIKKRVKVTAYAEDIMSKDIRTVGVNEKVDPARKKLIAERLGGMPVMDRGRVAGIITLVGLNKAVKSGFGHARVKGYMRRKVISVRPDTPLYAIRKIMSEKDPCVIPVTSGGSVVGVINRTDVLRSVYDSLFLKPRRPGRAVAVNLSKKINALIPAGIVRLMKKIGAMSNASGFPAFVVGGMVRDILMGKRNLDLDIVIEGDAIKLGNALAAELGATIVVHRKFGTCSLYTKDKLKIDLATARKESYARPAALPTVEFSSLKDDLVRRDFTVNAMAVSINKESFGRLIDFFGGRADLYRGRIRVMHDGSFIDDPTRIFRAVRFESRFSFAIDRHTEELIKGAIELSMFEKVEPQRIRDELALILKEDQPLDAIRRMAELDEMRFIHRDLRLDSDFVRLYDSINEACGWYARSPHCKRAVDRWLIYLMALFDDLSYNTVSSICGRFVFRGSDSIRIRSYKRRGRAVLKALAVRRAVRPSAIYRLLEPLSLEVTLLLMAKAALKGSSVRTGLVRSRIMDFLEKYNGTRIGVRGDDLKALGLKPSPEFKAIMTKLLYGKLDGRLITRKEELEYVKRLVKR
jgi:tRNA nucleotidyltransferase (CCA-adding enzyme)